MKNTLGRFGRESRHLERVLIELLKRAGATLVTVESCTGGGVADRITAQPGSSDVFWGALVTYQERAKSTLLGVSPALLSREGAVSPAVAAAMAEAGFKRAGGRRGKVLSVSTTGIAGPGGGTPKTPVGLCFIGIFSSARARARVIRIPPARHRISRKAQKARFADRALLEALREASRL